MAMLMSCLFLLLAPRQSLLEVFPEPNHAALRKQVSQLGVIRARLAGGLPAKEATHWRQADLTINAEALQEALDPLALLEVRVNPEGRVRVTRGPGGLSLRVGQATLCLVKVVNGSGGQQRMKPMVHAPGEVTPVVLVDWDPGPPGGDLTGLLVEYRLLRLTGVRAGLYEVVFSVEAGQGTQDLGFRGEAPVLVRIRKNDSEK